MVICSMRYLILIVLDWISVPFPHGPADSVVVQNLIQNLGEKKLKSLANYIRFSFPP